MKTIIVGGTGRVGASLISQLKQQDDLTIFAGARHSEKIQEAPNVKPFHLDLHDKEADIKAALPEADSLIFVAGSGGKDLLKVDLNGAVKVIQAAEELNINRFIMLSSRASLDPDTFSGPDASPLADYLIAKHFADEWLINHTNLDYTILQPTALTENKGSGQVTLGSYSQMDNSIDNVAAVLAGLLTADNAIGKVIEMSDGDTPINKAIGQVE